MAYSNDLTKVQNDRLLKKTMLLTLKGQAVQLLLTNNPKKFNGKKITKAVALRDYADESGSAGYGTGLISFNSTIPQTKEQMSFEPMFHFQEVAVDQRELDVNDADPTAAVKLKIGTMEEAAKSFSNKISKYIYGSAGADGSTMDSLKKICDDGTNYATYGGLTRASYQLADGTYPLKAYYYKANAALSSSNSAYIRTALSAATVSGSSPDLILTSKTIYNTYDSLITKTYNINSAPISRGEMTRLGFVPSAAKGGASMEIGFGSYFIDGAAVVADDACPSDQMFFITRDDLNWYGVTSTDPDAQPITLNDNETENAYPNMQSKNIGMAFRGWFNMPNQYGQSGQLILNGNLITFDPRKFGRIVFS